MKIKLCRFPLCAAITLLLSHTLVIIIILSNNLILFYNAINNGSMYIHTGKSDFTKSTSWDKNLTCDNCEVLYYRRTKRGK
jgi:hypothetical protein